MQRRVAAGGKQRQQRAAAGGEAVVAGGALPSARSGREGSPAMARGAATTWQQRRRRPDSGGGGPTAEAAAPPPLRQIWPGGEPGDGERGCDDLATAAAAARQRRWRPDSGGGGAASPPPDLAGRGLVDGPVVAAPGFYHSALPMYASPSMPSLCHLQQCPAASANVYLWMAVILHACWTGYREHDVEVTRDLMGGVKAKVKMKHKRWLMKMSH
uniref:Uncharacterized protein n=1 Tax=Oryza glumipatula TaxID=40148 RepID=A0A0E0BSX3_9ORYZ